MSNHDPLKIRGIETLHSNVYHALKEAIIQGHLRPGERLMERDLSARLNVSRTPIREAIKKLELEKMVVSHPYRGVRVAVYSPDAIEKMYTVRGVLDGLAARLATLHATPEDFERLEQCIDGFVAAYRDSNLQEMVRWNMQFHWTIAETSGNEMLQDLLDMLRAHTSLIRFNSLSTPDRPLSTSHEHRCILDAMKRRDAQAAEAWSIKHVEAAYRAAITGLQQAEDQEQK